MKEKIKNWLISSGFFAIALIVLPFGGFYIVNNYPNSAVFELGGVMMFLGVCSWILVFIAIYDMIFYKKEMENHREGCDEWDK